MFRHFNFVQKWLLFPLAYIGEQLQQLWDEYTSVPCEEWGGVFWWTGSIRIELNLQSCYQIRNTVRTTSKCLRDTFKRSSILVPASSSYMEDGIRPQVFDKCSSFFASFKTISASAGVGELIQPMLSNLAQYFAFLVGWKTRSAISILSFYNHILK